MSDLEATAREIVDDLIMWIPKKNIEPCVLLITHALQAVREADAKVAEDEAEGLLVKKWNIYRNRRFICRAERIAVDIAAAIREGVK